jgi:hypothetical protein
MFLLPSSRSRIVLLDVVESLKALLSHSGLKRTLSNALSRKTSPRLPFLLETATYFSRLVMEFYYLRRFSHSLAMDVSIFTSHFCLVGEEQRLCNVRLRLEIHSLA